jgi:AcrR family transcriptional regulator
VAKSSTDQRAVSKNLSPRRGEILEATCRVFARRGFASAGMRDIADEVGILAGSLYHHFKSKDDLLYEILLTWYEDIGRDLRRIIEKDLNADETLTQMLHLSCDYVLDRRDEAAIALNDFKYLASHPSFDTVAALADEAERLWIDVLRRGIRTGKFRAEFDAVLAHRTIIGALYSSIRWYDPRGAVSRDQFVRQMTSFLMSGLRATG